MNKPDFLPLTNSDWAGKPMEQKYARSHKDAGETTRDHPREAVWVLGPCLPLK